MHDYWWVAVVAVIAVVVYFVSRHKKNEVSSEVVAAAADWRVFYSTKGIVIRAQGDGFVMSMPQVPGHVDYVQKVSHLPRLVYGQTLTMRCTITGAGFKSHEYPDKPATVTLMLRRRGGNDSDMEQYEAYRQYSGAMLELKPGTFALSVPLDEAHFGGVYGSHDKAAFQAVLDNLESIGPVFGSAGGRGHGVCAGPDSVFELEELK